MANTTVLAEGTTLATSSDIAVAAGATVTVGLFTTSAGIPGNQSATLYIATPGNDRVVGELSGNGRPLEISGPGTFRVVRNACAVGMGVYTVT